MGTTPDAPIAFPSGDAAAGTVAALCRGCELSELGLDPLIQREFRALVEEAVAAGSTVLMSSHVVAEVELL